MGDFSDKLSDFAKTPERIGAAVYRRSIELLNDEMTRTKPNGGRVPVDTGNLYRSVVASKSAMPKTSEGPFTGSDVGAVVATLKLNEPLFIGWTAIYSRRMNYGFVGADKLGRVYNQTGNYFLEGAIAQWPQFVQQAVREIQQGSTK